MVKNRITLGELLTGLGLVAGLMVFVALAGWLADVLCAI